MAMVVKNNMSAVSTLNTLNKNSNALQKSLSKVSSGMKINSAQDDASGYAISEKMRVQIRSLDQANQNTQNGSSMMKTAEGAVSSTVEILKSLKEKAINAANDTNKDSDRVTIQKEIDQFIDQIDDNALVTFNGKYLVDGSKAQEGAATYTKLTNQSMATDTAGSTKLTELKNRNNESLEIAKTDYVTASYVKNGETFTTKFQVGDNDLQSIFTKMDENNTTKVFAGATTAAASGTAETAYNNIKDKADALAALVADKSKYAAAGQADVTGAASDVSNAATNIAGVVKTGDLASDTATITAIAAATIAAAAIPSDTNGVATAAASAMTNGTTTNLILTDSAFATDLKNAYKDYTDAVDAYNSAIAALDPSQQTTPTAGTGITIDPQTDIVQADSLIGQNAAGDKVYTADKTKGLTISSAGTGVENMIGGVTISITDSQGNVKKAANASLDNFTTSIYAKNKSDANELSFQVGANANQAIAVGLEDMRSEALGLKSSDGNKVSVATQDKANAAIAVFDNAINKALDQQTTIGSIEARLEYTSSNLTTSSENVQAAESTIRDADMAKEMTNYTKNNVLLQAAQSMLAQANQSSSAVLSLLQ